MTVPGKEGKTFVIKFDREHFKKGDLLTYGASITTLKVIKVYKLTWWRKLLMRMGFRIRLIHAVKVQEQ